jgi:phosphoribosylaminoimidazole-succinocarboxamide synthase
MIAMKYDNDYTELISKELNNCITETDLPGISKLDGKVRDIYDIGSKLILITTDRQSAFDRILAAIPFKGQVLNLTSTWWFEQTKPIVKNHIIDVPDPNVIVAQKCDVFPIEFVVRGYITGSTSTSLWTVYNKGSRKYCGNELPEGLVKNQRLEKPMLTPTTKEKDHDRPITPEEIVKEAWMSQADWIAASNIALQLFEFGQQKAKENGLILVDTKYEMGKDKEGNIVLIDEIHTPDSSRYWLAETYEERFSQDQEPQNIDKEFLRLWFVDNCDPYNDETLPDAPDELVIELSRRYILLYEMITRNKFKFPDTHIPANERLILNLRKYL